MSQETPRKVIFRWADVELIQSGDRYFVRYDAGSHQVVMREDEVTESEAHKIQSGTDGVTAVLFSLQRRLIAQGVDPYASNSPSA